MTFHTNGNGTIDLGLFRKNNDLNTVLNDVPISMEFLFKGRPAEQGIRTIIDQSKPTLKNNGNKQFYELEPMTYAQKLDGIRNN